MNRTTIQQFRAALAGRADQGTAMRAYRALMRDPRAALSRAAAEWLPWEGALNSTGWMEWQGDSAASTQPRARLAAWGDWSGPPARVAGA